jgi:hypothetical protein
MKSCSVTIVLLTLLLGACQPMQEVESGTEMTQTADAPASGEAVDRPLEANDESFDLEPTAPTETTSSEDEKAYPRATAALWAGGFLWTANESGLLTRWDVKAGTYRQYHLPGNPVICALASEGGTIYAGTEGGDIWRLADDGSQSQIVSGGVSVCRNSEWKNLPLTRDLPDKGALSPAIAQDNTVWVAGESYIARMNPGETWQVYSETDNPLLSGRSRFVVLDDEDHPWFVGRRGKIHFDGETWIAIDADVRRFAQFTPVEPQAIVAPPALDFPPPTHDYVRWLKTWPRPEDDNGLGMHFLQTHQFDTIEAQRQVNRMQKLGVHWALVHYADHDQLMRTAPIFQAAGITVIWRPFVRPYGTYDSWSEDVQFLRARGLAPYIQLYNEPSLGQEWDDAHPVDQETYWRDLLPAARQVYAAGGYIGLQLVNPGWLRLTLQRMKAQGMSDVFDRLFFVPHLYGLNHPPEYDEDVNSVLGFQEFARVFEEEIGFVPVMIAGEGGWRPGEAQDNRYPAVSEELHRNYHLAVFDWFRTGQLSNGEALPDYFFAFCPWLISDPDDPAAWFDSTSGDRTWTIEAVEAMPPFKRKFSWGQ